MTRIIVNGVSIEGNVEILDENKKHFTVDFSVRGESQYNLYTILFKERELDVKIPDLDYEFKATRVNSSSSYQNELNESTEVHLTFELKEYNEEEDNGWTIFNGYFSGIINNWSRTRALAELLEEKGIVSIEEYIDKIELVRERDFDEMREFIVNGKSKEE